MKRDQTAAMRSRKKQLQRFREALKNSLREDDDMELYRLRNLLGGDKKISRSERNRWSLFLTNFRRRYGEVHQFAFGSSSPMKPLVLAMDYLARRSLGKSAKDARWQTAKLWNVKESAVKAGFTNRGQQARFHIDAFIMHRRFRDAQRVTEESREDSIAEFLKGLPKRFPPNVI